MNLNDKSSVFISLLQSNKGIVYKIANSYCKNVEDRKDLVQEIIVQLWKSFEIYSDLYKYSTWMYRISLNVAISFYRKESRRKHVYNPLSEDIINFVETNITDDGGKNIGLLQQFISQLKDLDKALILLYLEEKSQKEMAEIIGISETNVATKIGRIKTILRQKFSNIKTQ